MTVILVCVRQAHFLCPLLQTTELRLRGPTDHEDVSRYDILIIATDRVASEDDPGHTCQVGHCHTMYPMHSFQTHHDSMVCQAGALSRL